MKRRILAILGSLAVVFGVVIVSQAPVQGATCDRNATPSTFAAEVSAATAGQTLCLASGNYGTWGGTNKAITVQSATGQGAVMALAASSGGGFTLASVTIAYNGGSSSSITGSARNITIKDSKFTGQISLRVQNANILLDHNTHNNLNALSDAGRVQVEAVNGQHNVASGVTVRNSLLSGGGADGLWTDVGASFIGNEMLNICNIGDGNHTDNIQIGIGQPTGVVVQGNFVHYTAPCDEQSFGFYSGMKGATITDNVVQGSRPWGIEVYSDDTSLVAHNTLVDHQVNNSRTCDFGLPCGLLDFTSKSSSPYPGDGVDPGFGTIVKDNAVNFISIERATLGQRVNNMVEQNAGPGDFIGTPVFVGGANPTTWAGFCLAAGSPGKGRASDGLDVGIRCNTAPPTTTTTTTPPTTTTTTTMPPTTTTTTPTTTTTTTPPTSVTMGETAVLPDTDGGNANLLLAQSATLGQAATLQSLSFYVTVAAGQLYLGVYDATGPNGGPGALKATTAVFTPVVGWNTKPVVTPVNLPAGTYWLAYTPSSGALQFQVGRDSGAMRYYSKAFGALPSTFATSTTFEPVRWSFYANLTTAPPPPPPATTTAAFTFTPANPTAGQQVTFDARTSTCATSSCTYKWEDDGPDGPGGTQWPFGTGLQVQTFTFRDPGIKRIRLTVTDTAGATATVMHQVTVQ